MWECIAVSAVYGVLSASQDIHKLTGIYQAQIGEPTKCRSLNCVNCGAPLLQTDKQCTYCLTEYRQ